MNVICKVCGKELDEKTAQIAQGVCPYCGAELPEDGSAEAMTDLMSEISSIRKTRPLASSDRMLGRTVPLRRKPMADGDLNTRVSEAVSKTVAHYAEIRGEDAEGEAAEPVDENSVGIPNGKILHGRYRILKTMGIGGFGITYKVWDIKDGVNRAVKEYFQEEVARRDKSTYQVQVTTSSRREEFEHGKRRLLNEAQMVARFTSPYIVRVNDYFEENGTSYMVMEFLKEKTFENYIAERGKKLTPDEAVELGSRICNALEEIHLSGVVHRDIAPDNILIGENGSVKIIDFGSARLSKEDIDDRNVTVKRGFAPLEQYEKIDRKNDRQQGWMDIYALGATLYYGLTGKVPAESIKRVRGGGEDSLQEPKELRPDIPDFLNDTIMTAMALKIEERFHSAKEMREALEQHRKVQSVKATRKKKRMRKTAGVAGAFAVIAVLIAGGLIRYEMRRNESVLPAATVSIWYAVSDDADDGMQKAMEQLQSNLSPASNDKFSHVNLELTAIPEAEYEARLKDAQETGNMPVLYQVPEDASWITDSVSEAELQTKLDENGFSCLFLKDFAEIVDSQPGVPIGFDLPVIYVNKQSVSSGYSGGYDFRVTSLEWVSDMYVWSDDLAGTINVIDVDPELRADYGSMLSNFESMLTSTSEVGDLNDFLNKEGLAYFGSASDYYTIQDSSINFESLMVGCDPMVCRFMNYWNISSGDKDTREVAEEVLAYMYCDAMQSEFYGTSTLSGLPLNRDSLGDYASGHKAFTEVLDEALETPEKFTMVTDAD